jgi:hypothetical protein
MATSIFPSTKPLVLFFFCLGLGLASAWRGVLIGTLMIPLGLIFLHYYLSTYVIEDNGLYQRRRFSGTKFVPYEKIDNAALYQGKLEKKLDIGDIQILDVNGKILLNWRMLPQAEKILNFITAAKALHALKK